ncbi:hypothetical protein M422DRAFT_263091 [Sphaerobolus stellatus SS14]|uniref:Uncharacterized protein n=1 Tax=Sphaerobolus stellatus (strain SS14) TaxID=990650 RepID=A0A0C9UIN6_SPHS4|nr:hypothetical protein M422DRAFT_263091 [Sphaerobolus stellatus SS14]
MDQYVIGVRKGELGVHFPVSMEHTPNTAQGLIGALYPNIQIPGISGILVDQYFGADYLSSKN